MLINIQLDNNVIEDGTLPREIEIGIIVID